MDHNFKGISKKKRKCIEKKRKIDAYHSGVNCKTIVLIPEKKITAIKPLWQKFHIGFYSREEFSS